MINQIVHNKSVSVYNVLDKTTNGNVVRHMIFVNYKSSLLMVDTRTMEVCGEYKNFEHFTSKYKLDVAKRLYEYRGY